MHCSQMYLGWQMCFMRYGSKDPTLHPAIPEAIQDLMLYDVGAGDLEPNSVGRYKLPTGT